MDITGVAYSTFTAIPFKDTFKYYFHFFFFNKFFCNQSILFLKINNKSTQKMKSSADFAKALMRIYPVLLTGLVIRIVLIVYGEWHDSVSNLKYTDIDYSVFSDAAVHVSKVRFC